MHESIELLIRLLFLGSGAGIGLLCGWLHTEKGLHLAVAFIIAIVYVIIGVMGIHYLLKGA